MRATMNVPTVNQRGNEATVRNRPRGSTNRVQTTMAAAKSTKYPVGSVVLPQPMTSPVSNTAVITSRGDQTGKRELALCGEVSDTAIDVTYRPYEAG